MNLLSCSAASLSLSVALVFSGCETTDYLTNSPAPDSVTEISSTQAKVGRLAENYYFTPTGQILTPAGKQVELPKMRPQALALSPDGDLLVTSGRAGKLVVIDPATGLVLQSVALSTNKAEAEGTIAEPTATASGSSTTNAPSAAAKTMASNKSDGSTNSITKTNAVSGSRTNSNRGTNSGSSLLSFTGLTFSPDGRRIYLSSVGGTIRVFAVDEHHVVTNFARFAVPEAKAPKRKQEIPSGLAVSADGKKLYVVGNLGNRLHELDATTGKVLRSWNTGVAPYDVVLAAGKAYVSNMGGRRPGAKDLTAPAGRGMTVRVDPVRHIADEGSVTVIDLASGELKGEILVELHASALAVSHDGQYVVVANTGSDTLSVIDTHTDEIVEKIWTRRKPADLFGAQPNALAFDSTGRKLFVCNGTQNAIAVIHFEPEERESQVIGLIPTGWFPGAIQFEPRRKLLCVANIKGIGSTRILKPGDKVRFNSKDFFGTISLMQSPSDRELGGHTSIALANMRYPKLRESKLPPRPGQPPRPVPERVGEPSVFKHVIYVIKENRTYDQVLGDMPEGNGQTNLCIFGEKYTPNQHQIARDFVLLDNTYCAGSQSADGHQWTDSAIANAYMERQVTSDFPRSYPNGKTRDDPDALAWASSGFIWDNVLAHGKTFRNYGEWMMSRAGWRTGGHKDKVAWTNFWNDYAHGSNSTRLESRVAIESMRAYSNTNTVGWDLNVPDQMRAAEFIKELRNFETNGGLPDFIYLFLPNDHTGGTDPKLPTPGAQVADNDLAFGKIVEAISHSQFWPETCLIAIEDDPQDGWDHVNGYRTTCYVVSPYTKRRQTVSTQFNQLSVIRTMELMLGLPPMNQLDATATPLNDCFVELPDLTPFTSVTNRVALDLMNPPAKKIKDRVLKKDAVTSSRLPLDQPDACPEDALNRILWHAMKGTEEPYPDWAVSSDTD
jgi:YVTN family beta-propeller protein